MAAQTGVFPVYENQFKIGADKATATTIADMETFSVSFSNGVETWTPMEHKGWQRALMTAKAVTITINGKRNKGDTGNDFIAKKAFTNGRDSEGYFCWTFPDGTTVEWDMAVFDVKNMGAAQSTKHPPQDKQQKTNPKPTQTPSV